MTWRNYIVYKYDRRVDSVRALSKADALWRLVNRKGYSEADLLDLVIIREDSNIEV